MVRIVSKKGKVYPNRAKNIVKKKAKTRLKYKKEYYLCHTDRTLLPKEPPQKRAPSLNRRPIKS